MPPPTTTPTAWRVAVEQAWASFARGDVGVGAVVVSAAAGEVLAAGQNRSLVVAPDAFSGSPVAHAEVDALRRLPWRATRGATLLTTLEPCPMCAGALVWAGARSAEYLAPDPAWHHDAPPPRGTPPPPAAAGREGPVGGHLPAGVATAQAPPSRLGVLAALLPLVTFAERLPAERLSPYRRRFPALSALAGEFARSGALRETARSGAPYAEAPATLDDVDGRLLAELGPDGGGAHRRS